MTDEQLKQMREKGMFFDSTPTFYGGFFLKITEPSVGYRCRPSTIRSAGSAGVELRSEVRCRIRYVLVLSGENTRTILGIDISQFA